MRFQRDDRGVSELLGAILVFGLVVAVLAVFQVNAIPADNAAVEFTHDQAVQSDFQLVRTAVVEAAGSNEPRAAAVDLGVTYPNRLLFVNPGPVAGTLRTVDAGAYEALGADGVNLYQLCGFGTGDSRVGTKSLDYSADYNVYAGDPVLRYENTVVHQRYANSDADLVRNDQALVSGDTISLFPLVGDVSYSGTNSQSVDFVSAGTSVATRTVDDPWTLVVPSALSADTWATDDRLLKNEANVLGVADGADGHVEVTMAAGTYDFRCTVVGVNEAPTGVTPIDETDGSEDDTGSEINPNDPDGSLVLSNVEREKNSPTYELTFTNTGSEDLSITDARLNFYYTARPSINTDAPLSVRFDVDGSNELLLVRGQYVDVTDFTVGAGDSEPLKVTFYTDGAGTVGNEYSPPNSDNFFVLSTFVGGESALYFVSVGETSTDAGGNGPTIESASASLQGSKKVNVEVAVADDDSDLASVNVIVQEDDGTGTWTFVAETTIPVSGGSDTASYTTSNLPSGTYRAVVTAADVDAGTDDASTTTNTVTVT